MPKFTTKDISFVNFKLGADRNLKVPSEPTKGKKQEVSPYDGLSQAICLKKKLLIRTLDDTRTMIDTVVGNCLSQSSPAC